MNMKTLDQIIDKLPPAQRAKIAERARELIGQEVALQDEFHTSMIEALAEAWASIDGKTERFHKGRCGEDEDGTFEGYCTEARELVRRLAQRGYFIVKAPP